VAEKKMMPIQPGDVPETSADIEKSEQLLGFKPKTPLKEGIRQFVGWYRQYYNVL
ncbi:MAG: protein CapI, partial [Deltaproteobacteria bacterium]|nr:protein CapI [Deltaproteobacteria bacterium]